MNRAASFHTTTPSWNHPTLLKLLLQGATLASDADVVYNDLDKRWQIKGDPTEGALVVAAAKAGLKKTDLESQFPRVKEIPFTSETKRMTTLHDAPAGVVAYAKGAPEMLLNSCALQLTESGETLLDAAGKEKYPGSGPPDGHGGTARIGNCLQTRRGH